MRNEKPTRCVDPVFKYCKACKYGRCVYPKWVKTAEDLQGRTFDVFCTLGYDQGRPEDEPTEDELREFDELLETIKRWDYAE